MNAALYFRCVVLLLPIAAIAVLGLLIDSLANFGLWEVFKTLDAPLYDPLGKRIWFVLQFLGLFSLGGAGFIPAARPFSFCAFVVKVYPHDWGFGSVLLFIPSLVSIALSIYCVVRPSRQPKPQGGNLSPEPDRGHPGAHSILIGYTSV